MERGQITDEQIVRSHLIRGALELLGGIGLIAGGVVLHDGASALMLAGGAVSGALGYKDVRYPLPGQR